ncbi:MAG: hypothetical protein GEU79_04660 [Acidimicrobiia bacterium]|nr:hypothetical protein [Acidimicrobiia bacterium]
MRAIEMDNGLVIGAGDLVMMGVINCSPESPNNDVFASTADEARSVAERHAAAGCGLIDIGARSTRSPLDLTCEQEVARLRPVVEAVVAMGLPVSLDTWSPCVVAHAPDLGVSLVNDTSGGNDAAMEGALVSANLPTIVMFSRGTDPRASRAEAAPQPEEIVTALGKTTSTLEERGLLDIILDPGIGIAFGDYGVSKERRQSQIIDATPRLRELGHPVMIPIPRKEATHLTIALASQAIVCGADVIRVHDSDMVRDLAEMHGR